MIIRSEPVGMLVVDKPAGCTSHDVVDRIRAMYEISKVGHAGTLDPGATGVLVTGLGKATRLLSFLQGLPKEYRAVAQFGVATDTQDADGEVVKRTPCSLTSDQVEAAAARFVGEIQQVPPMVSAVKMGGEPLYKAARRGEVVEREPRTVRVYRFDVEDFDPERQTATIFVRCSSGTYVRTLIADMGAALDCGAHLKGLRRTRIGSFDDSGAIGLDTLEGMSLGERMDSLLPMAEAMRDFPRFEVEGDDLKAVTHGRDLNTPQAPRRPGELSMLSKPRVGDRPAHEAGMTAGIPVAIIDSDGNLIAVYRRTAKGMKPAAVLV